MSVDLNHFRATTKPFVTTGKLGVVLAQVTPNLKNQPATRSYLEWLLASLSGYPE